MSDYQTVTLDTDEQKVSYGFGLQFGSQLLRNNFEGLDMNAVFTAMHHMINGSGSALNENELNKAYQAVEAGEKARSKARAEKALEQGLAHQAQFAQQDGVQRTESGLLYRVIEAGNGATPKANDTVKTHYHGSFVDGTVFDSSIQRNQVAEFGVNNVIPGWTEALQMMPTGAKWQLVVPAELAYGSHGAPPTIPANSTLCFDIELLAITTQEP
jgi:FKBP-type peptidyl-prolyl cis-trans isomerase FklB